MKLEGYLQKPSPRFGTRIGLSTEQIANHYTQEYQYSAAYRETSDWMQRQRQTDDYVAEKLQAVKQAFIETFGVGLKNKLGSHCFIYQERNSLPTITTGSDYNKERDLPLIYKVMDFVIEHITPNANNLSSLFWVGSDSDELGRGTWRADESHQTVDMVNCKTFLNEENEAPIEGRFIIPYRASDGQPAAEGAGTKFPLAEVREKFNPGK